MIIVLAVAEILQCGHCSRTQTSKEMKVAHHRSWVGFCVALIEVGI